MNKFVKTCLASLVLSTSFLRPVQQSAASFDQKIYEGSRTFAEIMSLVSKKHYNPENVEPAMAKAIDAFLTTLDPHSCFLEQKTYERLIESISGKFFGIGVIIDNTRDKDKDHHLTIIDTIPGGPADKAGIEPMDKIVEINGKALYGMTTDEITTLLKGPRNSTVALKIVRKDKPDLLSISITRDVVKEQHSLSYYIKDQNIYYLALTLFSQSSIKQIEQLLRESTKKQYKGIILDLRNNSGGLLDAVIDIAGMFIPKGSTVVTAKNKHGQITNHYKTTRDPILTKNTPPICILINNYTASAAEILAGVLKIYSAENSNSNFQVFLVGTKTHGKGSVQEVIPVSNNSAAKITISLYFFPDNTTIQGTGIVPDFPEEKTLPLTEQIRWFTKTYGREESFKNHIKPTSHGHTISQPTPICTTTAPISEQKATQRWNERAKESLKQDNQFRTALSLIMLLDTARTQWPEKTKSRNQSISFMKQHHITNEAPLVLEEVKV